MKKIIILFFLLLSSTLILHSNPIIPAVFSELYFDDNDNWHLELYDFYGLSSGNLDNCYLTSTSDTAYFNDGINFCCLDTLVVTNADMQTDFTIDKEGDFLRIFEFPYDEMCWGNYSNHINAPYSGQSLARVVIYGDDAYFLLAKENQPSLGYNPFDVQTFGHIEGIVTYNSGIPIYGADVSFSPVNYNVITDEMGYFCICDMYCMNYNLTVTVNDTVIIDTTVTIEPDGTTYIELSPGFGIDSHQHQEILTVSNHPNPFYEQTEIHYSLPHTSSGSITIFNSKGQKIKEIPVSPTENSVSWSGLDVKNKYVPSGVYFYNLESEDKTLASGKMLYLR